MHHHASSTDVSGFRVLCRAGNVSVFRMCRRNEILTRTAPRKRWLVGSDTFSDAEPTPQFSARKQARGFSAWNGPQILGGFRIQRAVGIFPRTSSYRGGFTVKTRVLAGIAFFLCAEAFRGVTPPIFQTIDVPETA